MPLKFLKKSRQYDVFSKDNNIFTIVCLGESQRWAGSGHSSHETISSFPPLEIVNVTPVHITPPYPISQLQHTHTHTSTISRFIASLGCSFTKKYIFLSSTNNNTTTMRGKDTEKKLTRYISVREWKMMERRRNKKKRRNKSSKILSHFQD